MKIGSDPELIAIDDGGIARSVIGKIGGDKDKPKPTEHGWVQEDGVLAEYNIHPVESLSDWLQAHRGVRADLDTILAEHGLRTAVRASDWYDVVELQHPLARIAGCQPDYNIWIKESNIPPDLWETQLRSAGGHIHIGSEMDKDLMVMSMDLYLGIPSVIMDEDTERKELYGKAGCYRDKDYGIEYRTLSNFWLRDKATMTWAYQQTERALEMHDKIDVPAMVEDIINSNNKEEAWNLIQRYDLEVV